MSPKKFLPLFVASVLTMITLAVATPASATTIDCEIPLALDCKVSHPDGIERVYVDAGLGYLFDKTYVGCPEEVLVSFDPITPNFDFVVIPCKPMKLTGGGDDGDHRRIQGPGDLKPAARDSVQAIDSYTEYCLKKYPFDPEKAYECSMGWVVH